MSNPSSLKNFKKGKGKDRDPRINKKGRPKTPKNLAELRETIQDFLSEPTKAKKTRLTKLIEAMARNRGERKVLLEFGFGKVPLKIEGAGDSGEHLIKFVDETKKKEGK